MKDIAAHRIATRASASLLALTIAGAFPLTTSAQTTGSTAPAQTAPKPIPPRPSSSDTAPAQTAPVAGPGIANSTVPNNEMVSGPLEPAVSQGMTPVEEEAAREGEVIVTGVRNAEASAIARKRTARTAQDSIVADDVGQFPDKNAAEAISRIAGVALDVADSGEQGGFTIRGQSADLIRIEVDGMTSLSANGDAGGRAAGVGEISSDLIKSVDVIKGQTADMTPGGVGGTVRIEQRTGLDFKEPLYRLNLQGAYQQLSQRLTPRINGIVTQKFFGGDVGVLLSGTYEAQNIGTDYARVSDKGAGYAAFGDLDNSPEKSFTQPFDPIAAAVTSKAGCAALTTTGINSRLNCYAQWEDFVPSLPRPGRQMRDDKRLSIQARVDWRVNRDLTVFASYNPNIRRVSSQDYNWSVGTPAGTITTAGVNSGVNITNAVVNKNHYVTAFDFVRGQGVTTLNVTSQVRDIQRRISQHYAQTGADFFSGPWTVKARAQFSQSTNEREDTALSIVAPIDRANYSRLDSGLWTIKIPSVDLLSPASYYPVVGANGISANQQIEYTPFADKNKEWNFQLDGERRFFEFGPITRIKAGIQHRRYNNESRREPGFQLTPGVVLSRARSLDLLQYCDPALAPASAPCQFGSVRRTTSTGTADQTYKIHTITRQQYQDLINASLIALPGAPFFSGAPNRGDLISTWGTYDVGAFFGQLRQIADLSDYTPACLYSCRASDGNTYDRPTYLTAEQTSSAYAMLDFELRPLGLLVDGNIGVRYQRIKVNAQPVVDFSRRVATPVTTPLPGYVIENQIVRREVGLVNRTSEDWLPSINIAAWPIEEKLGLRYSIALQRARPSILQLTGSGVANCGVVDPAQRAALEAFVAANPGAVQDDDPNTDDASEATSVLNNFVNRCSGRIGNPELKGYGARTQNLSLEWYPNRDTQLSAAVYQIEVNTGRPENVNIGAYQLGGDTYEVASFRDGPSGLRQRGFEIAGRTAFTFLPGFLRYFGGGFNYSYTRSNEKNTVVDPWTNKALPPRSQSKYYYNLNLWYDDTKLNARIAYQRRASYFDLFDAESKNRVPNFPGVTGSASTTSYFKYLSPIFKNGSETLDARASYSITKKFQLFIEGKNLLGTTIEKYAASEFRDMGDGVPYLYDSLYAGRTFYGGAIITF